MDPWVIEVSDPPKQYTRVEGTDRRIRRDKLERMWSDITKEGTDPRISRDKLERMRSDITKEVASWKKHCIYKIPASHSYDENIEAYIPHTVSLGPFHHGEERLKPMEERKHRALHYFLERSGKGIQAYVEALYAVVDDLKGAYAELDPKWREDTEAFLEMMILDGCFTLEILRTASDDYSFEHYASNDHMFSKHGKQFILPALKCDFLMLSNQLPLLVLEKLVAVDHRSEAPQETPEPEEHVTKLILGFFQQRPVKSMGKCLHILDVYRKSLLDLEEQTPNQRQELIPRAGSDHKIRRSATELYEAGIQFGKSKTNKLTDISFRDGVLNLPPRLIDDTTESVYLNLMAFELLQVGLGFQVTSYVSFMDKLIDSAEDVALLHSHDIIQNVLGSDRAAAAFFNIMSVDHTIGHGDRLELVHENLCAHSKRPWNQINKWRADCRHKYFTNPWACISLFAAIFLFVLALTQTVFGFLSYVNPS